MILNNIKKNIYSLFTVFLISAILVSCNDDEDAGPDPIAAFEVSTGTELKEGEPITFSASTSENAVTFAWSFGDGIFDVGETVTHIYEAPGDYLVTLEAGADGKRDVTTQTITISGIIPTPSFTVENIDDLKVGQAVAFKSTTTDALSLQWEFGDAGNSTSMEESPTFTYLAAGDYTVKLTATGTGGQNTTEQTITIQPNEFELYFIDNDNLKIKKIALSDSEVIVDVFDLPGFSFGLAYDDVNEELYYTDDDHSTLYKNNLEGTDQSEIATGLNGGRDIALDILKNKAYVIERSSDQITEIDLTNNSTSSIYSVSDDPFFLLPVGLDFHNGKLYATAVDFDAETVWAGGTDGSGISKIITFDGGGFGYGIEVDKVNDKIYFDDNDGGQILRANLDGSNIEKVGNTTDRTYGIAIDSESGKYYWAGRDGIIRVANLDGSEEKILSETGVDVRGMIIRKAK
ncbi:MAG: PKD domain-containing protein [Bacteroidota bacterium]